MTEATAPIGELVRAWRVQRRLSQLDLASEAEISQKHLSFIESGRAAPSRDMVLLLAERLDVPLRERNTLLLAAGFAPIYQHRRLDDPALAQARATLARILTAHEPYPALVLDRHWNMLEANAAAAALLEGVAPELLQPPINVLRVALHPRGLASRIVNLADVREHMLERLRRQVRVTRDAAAERLLAELVTYPSGRARRSDRQGTIPPDAIAVPLQLSTPAGVLSFLSTITVFGTPVEITLSELSLEAFYPADDATAAALTAAADARR